MSKPKKAVVSPRQEETTPFTVAFAWFFAVIPLMGWWFYGLFDLDEGFYGAVASEMNRRGEWITPYYNGHPWFEKPILLYWLTKPSLELFGDMLGPRLPCVLCTIGTYGVVWWFVRRRVGLRAGMLSLLILSGSLLVVAVGRMLMTDTPLLLCLTGALLTFWESLVGDKKWRIVTAGLLGLGVLAKGPVAIILFVIVAGWTFYRERDLRHAFKGYWLQGTAVMALIVAAWYVPAYLASGHEFVQKFLIEQNVGRFTGGDQAHTLGGIQSLLLYIPVFLVGMVPWSGFIFAAWPRKASAGDEQAPLNRYLATWIAVVFLFFTVSGAKLPHYILPLCPPVAILVAGYALKKSPNVNRWFYGAAAQCAIMCVVANAGFFIWYRASGQDEAQTLAKYVKNLGGNVAMYQMGRRQKSMGTGKLKIQETSLPSLVMYLDKDVLDTDDLMAIVVKHEDYWIITRTGRIQPHDFQAVEIAGDRLEEVGTPNQGANFRLYRLVKPASN